MLTQNVIEKHGGTITVRSKKGTGSEFIIRLPRRHP
jgi:signal transduction histidine kinase